MPISAFPAMAPAPTAKVRFGSTEPKKLLTLDGVNEILKDVQYKDWSFRTYNEEGRMIMQVRFREKDYQTGEEKEQSGRKWFLSPHMTRNEIVQTALKAVLTAEEHEARTKFRYKDEPIFGPHYDVDALVELCKQKRFDRRG